MSIAALYDIHGNLPALEAVLEEVRTLEIRETRYPQAIEFAEQYVLSSPPETTMLEAFTAASFR